MRASTPRVASPVRRPNACTKSTTSSRRSGGTHRPLSSPQAFFEREVLLRDLGDHRVLRQVLQLIMKRNSSVRVRVENALILALALALVYSLTASVLRLIGGARVLDQIGVSLIEMILFYFAAAIVGGGVAGLLLPLARHPVGGAVANCVEDWHRWKLSLW